MKISCNKCNQEMNPVTLAQYEYLDGVPLSNVPAYQCVKCNNVFFTEEMTHALEVDSQKAKT